VKLGQVKEPEAKANAARNVKLTAATSNIITARKRKIRWKLCDMMELVEAKITGLLTAQDENEVFSLFNLGCSEGHSSEVKFRCSGGLRQSSWGT
jgi:hypothetical protein